MTNPELAALGQPIMMPPDDQMISLMYVLDAPEAWWCALNVENPKHHVFNLSSEVRPVGDITRTLKRLLPDAVITASDQPVFDGQLLDNTRLVTELGFVPRYTLESALEDYVNRVRRMAGLPEVAYGISGQ